MSDELLRMLPLLAAIATLVASGVAAVTALIVAGINVRGSRRLALDSAHRAYRERLTALAIDAHCQFTESFRECWIKLVADRDPNDPIVGPSGAPTAAAIESFLFQSKGGREFEPLVTGNATFDRAIRVAADARGKAIMGVAFRSSPDAPYDNLYRFISEWLKRLDQLAVALRQAAEGYVFDASEAQRSASLRLDHLEPEINSYGQFGHRSPQSS